MRLDSERSHTGFFWMPLAGNKKLPGTLRIFQSGRSEVEVVADHGDLGFAFDADRHVTRVTGYLDDGRFVTLDACMTIFVDSKFADRAVVKLLVLPKLVLIGARLTTKEPLAFNSLTFSVQGLDEWWMRFGASTDIDRGSGTRRITYTPPPPITADLPGDISARFGFDWTHHSDVSQTSIVQKAYIRVQSERPIEQERFLSLAGRLARYFWLAIDVQVSVTSVTASADAVKYAHRDGSETAVPMELFFETPFYSEVEPRIRSNLMLFRYEHVSDCFEESIRSWLTNYDRFEPAFDLYFACQSGAFRFPDSKLLALVQGLEALHRRTSDEVHMEQSDFDNLVAGLLQACPKKHKDWLSKRLEHANELSLRRRLKCLVGAFCRYFGTEDQRDRLVSSVVEVRNYLTHWSQDTDRPCDEEMSETCLKLEALFQLHMLKMAGLSETSIDRICGGHNSLKRKLGR